MYEGGREEGKERENASYERDKTAAFSFLQGRRHAICHERYSTRETANVTNERGGKRPKQAFICVSRRPSAHRHLVDSMVGLVAPSTSTAAAERVTIPTKKLLPHAHEVHKHLDTLG